VWQNINTFLDIKEIKNGYFNFIKYLRINIKLFNRKIRKQYQFYKNIILFHLYYKFLNYKKYEDILSFENDDHFLELILIIKRKLELLKKQLKTDLTFDENNLQRLQELIELADTLIEIIKENSLVEKNQEYQKLSKSFFNKLYRLHDKLWYNYQNIEKEENEKN